MDMKKRMGNPKNEDCESFERVTILVLEALFEKKETYGSIIIFSSYIL